MQRMLIQRFALAQFSYSPEIHHRYAVADMLHHREVVRHKQVGQSKLFLQILHQVQYLCLDRHIERRYRLVSYDERGSQGQGARDADTLALTATKLMSKTVDKVRVETHHFEQMGNFFCNFFWVAFLEVFQRLCDGLPDGKTWAERAIWVLEHHLHVSPLFTYFIGRKCCQFSPIEFDAACRRFNQL